jgi:UDP-glucose 4-epimerase
VREVIAQVERASGRRVPVRERPGRPGDPPILTTDARGARQLLDWTPQYGELSTIIETALNWHAREFQGSAPSIPGAR